MSVTDVWQVQYEHSNFQNKKKPPPETSYMHIYQYVYTQERQLGCFTIAFTTTPHTTQQFHACMLPRFLSPCITVRGKKPK